MTISELMDKRAKLWNDMSTFLDAHRNDSGVLSAEDDATYARMETDMTALTNEIKRSERMEALNRELSAPTSTPIVNNPEASAQNEKGIASKAYRENFLNMLRGRSFSNTDLATAPDAQGGVLVPTEMDSQIVVTLADYDNIRNIAKVITTNSAHKIPVVATGSTATWTAEGTAYTQGEPTFTSVTLDAFKLTDLIKVSIELLEDSAFDIESFIAEEIARAFGAKEEEGFCVGTGSGQPTGIFTANGGSLGKTTTYADDISADEVIDLVYSLAQPYRRNAKFVMNDATVALVRKLKAGNDQYLWTPGISAGQPDTLLGYEVVTSSFVPTMAKNAYVAAFGDFSNFWIGDRSGRTIQRLNELYAVTDQVGFKMTERLDGRLILPEAVKCLQMKA